jgi:hypothetical protein
MVSDESVKVQSSLFESFSHFGRKFLHYRSNFIIYLVLLDISTMLVAFCLKSSE